jgi:polyisoprenoid-binding protein YceI
VKASVAINGTFDKWDATLTFASTDVSTGVLDIKIQADSVNTGSGMKDGKLKSKDFFNADQDPLITFLSKRIVQTGPTAFDVQGDFTIGGATKPQTLTLTVSGAGTGSGEIHGTRVFGRKDYGMNKGIPFVRIGDSVSTSRRSESVVLRLSLSNRRPATLPDCRAATRIMEYGGQGNL